MALYSPPPTPWGDDSSTKMISTFFPMPLKFHIKVKQQKVGITFALDSSLFLFACFLVLPSLLP